jgi:hypothetical protein
MGDVGRFFVGTFWSHMATEDRRMSLNEFQLYVGRMGGSLRLFEATGWERLGGARCETDRNG